ncbi:MAG: translation elongation factor Ts [Christensenellales bacterium]
MFTAEDVKKLREMTGVGMLDCRNALNATEGNIEKAVEFLREKGMAAAAKKASRIAAEGVVQSYIHMGGKIGVLVEINCETDFVARSDNFIALTKDIAMQIAAANPKYVSISEIPEDIVAKEREIVKATVMNEASNKPAQIIEKMVDGKMNKFYKEVCLYEQEFVKDPSKTITQVMNEAIQSIGEKLTIRRFTRYEMGEGLEKRKENFAEEVAKYGQK